MLSFLLILSCSLAVFTAVRLLVILFETQSDCNKFDCNNITVKGYLETHPPISDDEFVRLCGPEVTAEVALKVRGIISEVSCIAEEKIYPEARFVKDLGME